MIGSSIELYFVDGKPDGMVTAEMFNWTGHVLRTPRTLLQQALQRRETKATGVYVLLDDFVSTTKAYVGEAEDVAQRIRTHDAAKDWWTVAVICTTASNALNKAHAKYLEARLVKIALDANPHLLENSTRPSLPGLNEAAQANMERFIENLMIVLPALRVDVFNDKTRPSVKPVPEPAGEEAAQFELHLKKEDLRAKAILKDGEFVVQPGSDAREEWIGTDAPYSRLREKLVASGVIFPGSPHFVFERSYAFASPSAASAVVLGRSDNGRTTWRHVGSGKTYAEWESQKLEEATG